MYNAIVYFPDCDVINVKTNKTFFIKSFFCVAISSGATKKQKLVKEFDRKFSIKILEKAFHALRASFLRELKKY